MNNCVQKNFTETKGLAVITLGILKNNLIAVMRTKESAWKTLKLRVPLVRTEKEPSATTKPTNQEVK